MLDDFFTRAMVAGIGIAMITGPLGCFVVWKRLAFFGDTLAHAALLGIALGLLLNINMTVTIVVVTALLSLSLLALQQREGLPTDAILGLLSHSALAIGLVVLALMTWVRVDLLGFLFGDILAVSRTDIGIIYAGGLVILCILYWIWHPLFAATVNRDLAAAEGVNPGRVNVVFTLLLAMAIAVSMIIPASSARFISRTPEQMAVLAALAGITSVVVGLYASLIFDTPSGPSIVVASVVLFVVALVMTSLLAFFGRRVGTDT